MIIVDSCGWLEWFTDGKLADKYQKYLEDQENLSKKSTQCEFRTKK